LVNVPLLTLKLNPVFDESATPLPIVVVALVVSVSRVPPTTLSVAIPVPPGFANVTGWFGVCIDGPGGAPLVGVTMTEPPPVDNVAVELSGRLIVTGPAGPPLSSMA